VTGSYRGDEEHVRPIRRQPPRFTPRRPAPPRPLGPHGEPLPPPPPPRRPFPPPRAGRPGPVPPRTNDPRSLPPSGINPPSLPAGGVHPPGRPPLRPAPPPRAVNHAAPPPPPPAPPQAPQRPRSAFDDSDIGRLPPLYYEEDDDGYDDEHDDGRSVGGLLDGDPPPARPRRRPAKQRPAKQRPDKRRPAARRGRPKQRRKRSRAKRFAGWLLAIGLVAGLAAGAWFGARELLGIGFADYRGSGKGDVVVQVVQGDSTAVIADRLAKAGVVASGDAFVSAAENNSDVIAIRPGYYQMKKLMSGASAVKAILAKDARVGELQIRSGTQLDDLKDPNGKKIPGIYTRMSEATCAKLNGKDTCIAPEKLRAAAAKADLVQLGAPSWLVKGAAKAPAERRLEGMIMPGLYDLKPGWDAERVLREVLTVSAAQFEAAGLPDTAKATKRSPYQVVVIASMIEREAVENDFGKVSRVIYNRLAEGMRLEMDSTINYVLDRPHIRTSSTDRNKPGPYNSYKNKTLPPTPISSPSAEALQAALKPESGKWVYFVKCEKNGLSCFTADFGEHQANVTRARERGVW
jgi:UPF0755 protein